MPYDQHLRLTGSGRLVSNTGVTLERFSVRLNLSDPPAGSNSFDAGRHADYEADFRAFWARPASGIASVAMLDEVKLAEIGADGKYRSEPIISAPTSTPGGAGGMRYPLQVAFVVSLNTDRRGASGKGRVFLPCPGLALYPSDGRTSAGEAQDVATSFAQFIDALNDVPGLDASAPKVTIASGKGYNSDVTSVRCGRVFDTVRSRRTSQVESYGADVGVA